MWGASRRLNMSCVSYFTYQVLHGVNNVLVNHEAQASVLRGGKGTQTVRSNDGAAAAATAAAVEPRRTWAAGRVRHLH